MAHQTPEALDAMLVAQGAAPSHRPRLAALRALCERTPACRAMALVGSFAQGRGDRISDLDLAAFVEPGHESAWLAEARPLIEPAGAVLHAYGLERVGEVAMRKVVYLDFASCELHAFNADAPFRLRRPFVAVWDPHDTLAARVVDGEPPRHESFQPYPHGDDGLIWELVDCVKWLQRGRTALAKNYLRRLGRALGDGPDGDTPERGV